MEAVKPKIERKRTIYGLEWYIDGVKHAELQCMVFINLSPIFEKILLHAAKTERVRLIREDYTSGGYGYCITMTGLQKFINVL